MKVFELEYGISLAGVLSGRLVISIWIGASERMVKEMSVVILSVSIAG